MTLFALLAGLLAVQVVSARAARRIGGSSARMAIVLRAVNAAAVIILLVWLLVERIGG